MARLLTSALTQYFSAPTAVVTAMPLTMGCWGRVPATGAQMTMVDLHDVAATNYFTLTIRGTGACRAKIQNGATGAVATSSTTLAANRWGYFSATFTSNVLRAAYINGAGEGTNTTDVTPTGIDSTAVGIQVATTTISEYWNGDIEWPAIWNVVLSRTEMLLLAGGMHPVMIRPQNLVFLGDTQARSPDLINIAPYANKGLRLTNTGGAIPLTREPPLVKSYARTSLYMRLNAAAAAGYVVPRFYGDLDGLGRAFLSNRI